MYTINKMNDVDNQFVRKFAAIGIHTTDDLIAAGGTGDARRKLAGSLGTTTRQMRRWISRADLIRVAGIGDDYAALLETARVRTVDGLAGCSADVLHGELNTINRTRRLVRRVPSVMQLGEWIDYSRTLPKLIEE